MNGILALRVRLAVHRGVPTVQKMSTPRPGFTALCQLPADNLSVQSKRTRNDGGMYPSYVKCALYIRHRVTGAKVVLQTVSTAWHALCELCPKEASTATQWPWLVSGRYTSSELI